MQKDRFSAVITGILFLAVCAYGAVFAWEGLGGDVKTVPLTASCVTVGARIRGIAVRDERELEEDKREYEDGARLPAGNMAPCSVLYFSECDGFEYLTAEMFRDMSASELDGLLESDGGEKGRHGKTVSGFEWYIAAASEDGRIPEKGSLAAVELPDGTRHRVECVYVPEKGEVFLLRLTDGDSECKLRKLEALLVEKRIEGFKIPIKALHEDAEGNNFVFALRAGRAQAAPAEKLYGDGEYCLVSSPELCEGERIIVSGKDIYDGKVIS